jgi:hypothetical protein
MCDKFDAGLRSEASSLRNAADWLDPRTKLDEGGFDLVASSLQQPPGLDIVDAGDGRRTSERIALERACVGAWRPLLQ